MLKRLAFSTISVVAALGLTSPLLAQSRSAVSSAELDAAAAARPMGHRDALRGFLMTDQAQTVAARMGVSPSDLSARLATLDDASLDGILQGTELGDRILAGGDGTIVISTTAVIIGLLLLILLTK